MTVLMMDLVFLKSVERGKCFIEYIPAENAWLPIIADGYIHINSYNFCIITAHLAKKEKPKNC